MLCYFIYLFILFTFFFGGGGGWVVNLLSEYFGITFKPGTGFTKPF